MRLNRNRNRMFYRRDNRLLGCLPYLVTMSLIVLIAWGGRGWLWDAIQRILYTPATAMTLADGQNAFANGDLDTAIAAAQLSYANQPDDSTAILLLIRSLIYRSYADYDTDRDRLTALDYSTTYTQQYPLDWDALAIHAFAQQANQQHEEASRTALRVIRQDTEHVIARIALSLSYGSQGLFEAAIREGRVAVEIANTRQPDWRADAYRVLAIALSDNGRYTEAGVAAEQAISYRSKLVPLYFERALYASQLGDMDTATAAYFNIIAFDKDNIKSRLRLCELSSKLSEREAAITYCQYVTDNAPGWSDGWYALGREYYLKGDWANARQVLGRCSALQIAQNIAIAERELQCWYMQGQAAEVLRDCDRLLLLYNEFQEMVRVGNLPQTWVYPPSGPPVCIGQIRNTPSVQGD